VVHAKPHEEDRAALNLRRQAYEVYCPRTRKVVRHARKVTQHVSSLFPGYLFVRLDLSCDHWRSVNGTRGVVKLVTFQDIPAAVPVGIVEALQSRTDLDGAIMWSSCLKEGQQVEVADGPFAGLIGTLQDLSGADRVCVLLNLLGRSVAVTLRADLVAPVG